MGRGEFKFSMYIYLQLNVFFCTCVFNLLPLQCSSTCEGGWQQRRVACQDESGLSDLCSEKERPPEVQPCNSGPCPMWNYGQWGDVSTEKSSIAR